MSHEQPRRAFPYVFAGAAAAAFSWSGPILRLAENAGGEFWAVISIRCGISLILLMLASRRVPRFSRGILFCASLLTAQFILFSEAVTIANPGTVAVLVYTSLLWVPLMAFFLTKEKITGLDIVTSVALLNASAVAFLDQLSFQEHLGMLLAMATGFIWSLSVVLTSKECNQSASAGADAFIFSGALLVLFSGACWALDGAPIPRAASFAWATLGGFQSALALLLFVPALRTIGSTRTNIACSTIDPTCATLWAWLVFGKRPAYWAFVGGGCIVGILIVHGLLILSQEREKVHG